MSAEVPITVDPDSPEPPFEQIKRQVRELMDTGRLRAGDKLPTVRRLAESLGIAPNNARRYLDPLEIGGILRSAMLSKRERYWAATEVLAALDGFADRAGACGGGSDGQVTVF